MSISIPSQLQLRKIEDINGHSDVNFAVITGDVTEFGSDEELQKTKEILDELNTMLGM
ncbi:MAG: hypothetical protein WD381_02335 [Balneolaceae bacterium]